MVAPAGRMVTRIPKPLLAGALLLPVVYLYLQLFRDTVIDDAYITLQYATTLRDHGHWGFFPDRVSNTATSPLNVILTALAGLFTADIVDAAIALAAVEATLLVVVLCLTSRALFGNDFFGIVGSIGLLANPLLLSTLGLESLLYALGLTTSLFLVVRRLWPALAVVLALLTLTRPDGVLLFAAVLPFVLGDGAAAGSPANRLLRFCAVYAVCLAPWYLYSWIAFGSALPDTFFIKVANPWGKQNFFRGLPFFLRRYPLETVSSFWLAPLALLGLASADLRVRRLMLLVLVFALAYFTSYALLRVAPYHWYYAPLAASSVLLGALGAAAFHQRDAGAGRLRGLAYAAPILAILGLASFLAGAGTLRPIEAPIHTNWATPAQYRSIGLWLRDHLEPGDAVRVRGEIGTIAFYSRRRLMDPFTCRGEAPWLQHRLADRNALTRWLVGLNFYWFESGEVCGPYDYDLLGTTWREGQGPPLPQGTVRQWPLESRWVASGRLALVQKPELPRGLE